MEERLLQIVRMCCLSPKDDSSQALLDASIESEGIWDAIMDFQLYECFRQGAVLPVTNIASFPLL